MTMQIKDKRAKPHNVDLENIAEMPNGGEIFNEPQKGECVRNAKE